MREVHKRLWKLEAAFIISKWAGLNYLSVRFPGSLRDINIFNVRRPLFRNGIITESLSRNCRCRVERLLSLFSMTLMNIIWVFYFIKNCFLPALQLFDREELNRRFEKHERRTFIMRPYHKLESRYYQRRHEIRLQRHQMKVTPGERGSSKYSGFNYRSSLVSA